MNQKIVIYIILSVILLYLYYKKHDKMILVVFTVLAGSLLFSKEIVEGAKGGRGGDKECAKLGFIAPKIDKKDIKGSLEKTLKNIESVAKKHWPFDDMAGHKPKNDKATEKYEGVTKSEYFKDESKKLEKDKEKQENAYAFIFVCAGTYGAFIGEKASEEDQKKVMKELTSEKISKAIKGGETYLNLLKKNHKTLEGSDVKKLSSYITCLCEQWLQILKQYKKAGDDNEDGDDDEDSGNKKKKTTKKKKSEDDDDDDE